MRFIVKYGRGVTHLKVKVRTIPLSGEIYVFKKTGSPINFVTSVIMVTLTASNLIFEFIL